MKVVAAVGMWDVCMEKGHRDLEQFEKVHRYISDQLFANFVSDFLQPSFRRVVVFLGFLNIQLVQKVIPETCCVHQEYQSSSSTIRIGVLYSEQWLLIG